MKIEDRLKVMQESEAVNAKNVERWRQARSEHRITGVLVDVARGRIEKITIDKALTAYYSLLNCRCIDIVARCVGTRETAFYVVCDDEGLLVDTPKISAISRDGEVMFCGNLFIVKSDGADDLASLTDDEIEYILRHKRLVRTIAHPDSYYVLDHVEYAQ